MRKVEAHQGDTPKEGDNHTESAVQNIHEGAPHKYNKAILGQAWAVAEVGFILFFLQKIDTLTEFLV